METRVSERNQKWIKIGLLWNAVTLLLSSGYNGFNAYQNGASFSSAGITFLLLFGMGAIVLYLNIYAYQLVLLRNMRQVVNMALIMACISIFSLNIVGALILIFTYMRIRRDDITI